MRLMFYEVSIFLGLYGRFRSEISENSNSYRTSYFHIENLGTHGSPGQMENPKYKSVFWKDDFN